MSVDLDTYRQGAAEFLEAIDREHYLHLAGRKPELEVEPIYARHRELFGRDAVRALREAAAVAAGEEARRLRYLLLFAFEGHVGRENRVEAEEIAHLEASLEVEAAGERLAYRAVPVAEANSPDPDRRGALAEARDALLGAHLNPLHRAAIERTSAIAADLGWPSYREACAELRGVDLDGLAAGAERFLRDTDPLYAGLLDPELERAGVVALGELRRCDVPRFFRAPALDGPFASDRLLDCFAEALSGLGLDLGRQRNVHLDTESRPTKSPRAFCATPRVPDEIYLVVSPVGGRDDYAAMFHEGGHAEHYAAVDAGLPLEYRHLGDNSVTESFAFLLEHLTHDPGWLASRLAIEDPGPVTSHARAAKLLLVRRYAAKLAYELELHGPTPDLEEMPDRYVELLGGATRVRWTEASWLADVDPGFYVACYLRAWALETHWRRALRERFGDRWFESPAAGEWLRGLWRQGQRLDADELLEVTLGERLDLGVLARELVGG